MDNDKLKNFFRFAIRVILLHLLTYVGFGLVMSNLFNYGELFQQEIIRDFMLPIDTHALLGVAVQPIRGLLFAIALWPIWAVILERKRGWLIVWSFFLVFGILSTTGAAPSSIEGALYSKLPLWYHLIGLPEISLQTLTFSYLLVWWEKRQVMPVDSTGNTQQKGFFSDLLLAFVIGCFAYIGFALSSLAVFFTTAEDVEFSELAGDARGQIMFVVALVFNIIFIFFISKRWLEGKISAWAIFGMAWALDAVVVFAYQSLVFGSSDILNVILISVLPAAIIALAIPRNYKISEES